MENPNIKEYFDLLKREIFGGADVENVVSMSESEQQAFMREWVDRFMEGRARKAAFLKEQFWSKNSQEFNPLLNHEIREQMNDDERLLCAFYVNLSGLCKNLLDSEEFEPLTLGINAPAEFYVDNEPLVDFMLNAGCDNTAAYMAQTMRSNAMRLMGEAGYLPAKDFLEVMRNDEYEDVFTTVSKCRVPRSDYTLTVVQSLRAIDQHLEDGDQMGLDQNEIFMHDNLLGQFSLKFEPKIIPAVQKLCTWIESNKFSANYLDRFEELAQGMITRFSPLIDDDHLALEYMMAQAEMALGA